MIKFRSKRSEGALYCLPKDSLKKNKPQRDLYMSGDHAFKHNGIWKHMKCASGERHQTKGYTYETEEEEIEYYHIIIEDYFAHTIVAEGVEVETCYEDKEDGVMMVWNCSAKSCVPLKGEQEIVKKKEEKKVTVNRLSLKHIMDDIKNKPQAPRSKMRGLSNSSNQKKSLMTWKYDRRLERNVAIECKEINLPN